MTCYSVVDRVEIHPGPVGGIEVRLSGEPAGATIVLRLDPDGASRLATALTHAANRTARRDAG